MKRLLISLILIFSLLLISTPASADVGMSIRKGDSLTGEQNLYWAFANSGSTVNTSLMKLQVTDGTNYYDRFRVDPSGNVKAYGVVDAKELCIDGVCKPAWPGGGGAGLWEKNGDEIYYDTDYVGIGTNDPRNNLHVNGSITVPIDEGINFNEYFLGGQTYALDNKASYAIWQDADNNDSLIFEAAPSGGSLGSIIADTDIKIAMAISENAQVGIGTADPEGYDLKVGGSHNQGKVWIGNNNGHILKTCDTCQVGGVVNVNFLDIDGINGGNAGEFLVRKSDHTAIGMQGIGGDLYVSEKIGIGTSGSNQLLSLYKDTGDNAELTIQSVAGANKHWGIYQDRGTEDLKIWHGETGNSFVFSNTGNLGIGSNDPQNSLDVVGGGEFTGTLMAANIIIPGSLTADNITASGNTAVAGSVYAGSGLRLGSTNICDNGVLRYEGGKIEYCHNSIWKELGGSSCTPNCSGRNCGSNGCGGSCGSCSSGQVCSGGNCVGGGCTPNCSGKNCGGDGCGGSCGSCTGSQTCSSGSCVSGGGGTGGVAWDAKISNGQYACNAGGYGSCLQSYTQGSYAQSCFTNSYGGSATCDASNRGVAWASILKTGQNACNSSGYSTCVQSYTQGSSAQSCFINSYGGSATCQ